MPTVVITVAAPDVKDCQPVAAAIIREMWLQQLTVKFQRTADNVITVSERSWIALMLAEPDPYITLSTQ